MTMDGNTGGGDHTTASPDTQDTSVDFKISIAREVGLVITWSS